jgi:hypothetical protein
MPKYYPGLRDILPSSYPGLRDIIPDPKGRVICLSDLEDEYWAGDEISK